ncbi:protein of unknown function [Methylocaldum szegediense]|uniref:Uncharacterized protein n=1 Tax=Methylocaldum szegediense TaxID=73780 RepID=A0ABN8X5H8_9GAMM|nr:protein of unknown function [Methylocaldum szegediense]
MLLRATLSISAQLLSGLFARRLFTRWLLTRRLFTRWLFA